jgi:hypothetical protein
MTLEIEKLRGELHRMALSTAGLRQEQRRRVDRLREVLNQRAGDWAAIHAGLARAEARSDPKYFRAARPLHETEPLDTPIAPPAPPGRAILIATDGSQIMPSRHAAFLYYLVNVGAIVYFHGENRAPVTFSDPRMHYPQLQDDQTEDEPGFDKSAVTIERDLLEIGTLTNLAWEHARAAQPRLALLDQRLLYYPFSGGDVAAREAVAQWAAAVSDMRESGALVAGYIDRPGKRAVITLLETLMDKADADWEALGKRRPGDDLTDASLYAAILGPGERSPVFADVSPANDTFAAEDPLIAACFFYFNPGSPRVDGDGQRIEPRTLARVDIPLWVAQDQEAVALVHSLIYDQCRLTGYYPYILTRAHELAVVGKLDADSLNDLIELYMQEAGVMGSITAKQSDKELVGGHRTRFAGP